MQDTAGAIEYDDRRLRFDPLQQHVALSLLAQIEIPDPLQRILFNRHLAIRGAGAVELQQLSNGAIGIVAGGGDAVAAAPID
jgi:hypothetical protein